MKGREIKILFVSNGHAEDMIACAIIKYLKKDPSISIKALPIVGKGLPYISENIPVLGPCKTLPSEGLARFKFKYLLKDIKHGLINLLIKQIKVLKNEGKKADLIVAVGDVFVCALSGLFTKKKIILLLAAQSVRAKSPILIEKINLLLLRRYASIVFTKDNDTALYLKRYGIPGIYFGNVMIDCIEITGEDFGIPKDKKVIGVLPGSRKDTYKKLEDILEVLEEIGVYWIDKKNEPPLFLLALAPTLDIEEVKKVGYIKGWEFEYSGEKNKGILGYLKKSSCTLIISNKFGDVINRADVIIGLSGTANIQAAGIGKLVISFPVKGIVWYGKKSRKKQMKIVGNNRLYFPFNKKIIVEKIYSILNNYLIPERTKSSELGRQGAAQKIALYIKNLIEVKHF